MKKLTQNLTFLVGLVTNAFRELACSVREKFMANIQNGLLKHGSAVTVDGVNLKVQGRHYYDFSVHYMKVSEVGHFRKFSSRFKQKRC